MASTTITTIAKSGDGFIYSFNQTTCRPLHDNVQQRQITLWATYCNTTSHDEGISLPTPAGLNVVWWSPPSTVICCTSCIDTINRLWLPGWEFLSERTIPTWKQSTVCMSFHDTFFCKQFFSLIPEVNWDVTCVHILSMRHFCKRHDRLLATMSGFLVTIAI